MLGVFVNTLTVLVGGLVGLLIGKGIPERLSGAVMSGIGLCCLYIGVDGMMEGSNALITILSMVLGVLVGELLQLDARLESLGEKIGSRFKGSGEKASVSQGFVTASLLFCTGAMTIMGALQSGLTGDHNTLFTKAVLDLISSLVLAASLGVGVMFSALFVLIYEGALTLLAQWVSPLFSQFVVAEMTCVGSILIVALGLNLLGITKLKIMNFLPAVFIPILICRFFQ